MKISIIEELLNGELQTRWEATDKSPEANEVYAEYRKYNEKIYALLSPEHSKLWDDCFLAEGGVFHVERNRAFRIGARFGLFLALELLEEETEPVS